MRNWIALRSRWFLEVINYLLIFASNQFKTDDLNIQSLTFQELEFLKITCVRQKCILYMIPISWLKSYNITIIKSQCPDILGSQSQKKRLTR